MSFKNKKYPFLMNDSQNEQKLSSSSPLANIDLSDLKVMIIKDFFNHKQRSFSFIYMITY